MEKQRSMEQNEDTDVDFWELQYMIKMASEIRREC